MNKYSQTVIILFLILLLVSACEKSVNEETDAWGKMYSGTYIFTTVEIDMQTFLSDTIIYEGSISAQAKPYLKIEYLSNAIIYPTVDDNGVLEIPGYGGGHDSFSGKFDSAGQVEFYFRHYYMETYVRGIRK